MSKLYREPVEIRLTRKGLPMAFRWRRRWYLVTGCCLCYLTLQLRGYRLENAYLPRYRCETDKGMVCDLVQVGNGWQLERVWD